MLIWWRSAASGLSRPSSSLVFDTPRPSVATRMSASSSLRGPISLGDPGAQLIRMCICLGRCRLGRLSISHSKCQRAP